MAQLLFDEPEFVLQAEPLLDPILVNMCWHVGDADVCQQLLL